MGLFSDKIREVRDEFNEIARGRDHSFEALLPFVVFFILALVWRIDIAAGVAFTIGLLFLARNLLRSRSLIPPLSGLLVLAIGIFAVYRSGRAGDVLLSNIGTNGLVLFLCLASLVAGRPFVAWTSYFARHYPLAWYWHPRVRPAYTEVTILWVIFFGSRLFLQLLLLRSGREAALLVFSILSGWPSVVGLLVASYLYGTWRLRNLGGPSVERYAEAARLPSRTRRVIQTAVRRIELSL